MKRDTKRTGNVAAEAGVNIQTLRYYERRGILKEPPRMASGYRGWPPDTVRLNRFIKRAQDVGFTLDEIDDLLRLRVGGDRKRAEVRVLAEAKVRDIDGKVRRLQAMKGALERLVETCARNGFRARVPDPRAQRGTPPGALAATSLSKKQRPCDVLLTVKAPIASLLFRPSPRLRA